VQHASIDIKQPLDVRGGVVTVGLFLINVRFEDLGLALELFEAVSCKLPHRSRTLTATRTRSIGRCTVLSTQEAIIVHLDPSHHEGLCCCPPLSE
jgi:hypothetical protein